MTQEDTEYRNEIIDKDEVLKMARQVRVDEIKVGGKLTGLHFHPKDLMDFAKLVRNDYSNKHAQLWLKRIDEAVKAEREACAVIAEEWFCGCGRGNCPEGDRRAHDIADSIRARGEA